MRLLALAVLSGVVAGSAAAEGAWHIETVDSLGDVGAYSSLALDSEDRPHISYHDASEGSLRHARLEGTTWLTETVNSGVSSGLFISMELDHQDHPHIAYYDSGAKLSRWDGQSWHTETVARNGSRNCLAPDTDCRPHICYYDPDGENLIDAVFC